MKLFWKIFLAVFSFLVIFVLVISYIITLHLISDAKNHIVGKNRIISHFISKEIESGYLEARWPYESLYKISKREGFLFWWIVRVDGTIYLADTASFIKTRAREYFPQIAKVKNDVFLDFDQSFGICFNSLLLGNQKWSLWVGFSLNEVYQNKKSILFLVGSFFLTALIILGIVLFIIIKHFIKPIDELTNGTAMIRRGEVSYRIKTLSTDELGQLAKSFNRMAEALKESEYKLQIRNQISDIFIKVPDDKIYFEVLKIILKALDSPYGAFAYINEHGDRVVPSLTRDIWVDCRVQTIDPVFPRESWRGLWGKCLIDKETVISNGPFNVPEGHVSITRAIATPIIHRGEAIGNFMVANKTTDYGELDKQILESIADHIAPLLNARLLRDRQEEKRKHLEAQLRQAHKMEAIGTLAGGIAHEFNNILGIIIGNTELAINDVPEWNPANDCLQEIRTASLRAKDVVRQILGFARKSVFQLMPVRISPIVKEGLKLIRASTPATITVRQNLSCTSDTVMADSSQINQVLMNLCTNANNAMQEEGGVLEVKVEDAILDEESATLYEDLSPGNYVKLTVKDTGHGIDPEIMDRIFDPYFTTTSLAEGTGMGLAVVYGIVKRHNGAIRVASEPGKGTVVEVLFPLSEAEAKPETKKPEAVPTGSERILFVDDEESLVKTVQKMLKQLGYRVETQRNPIEALARVRSDPDRFDLVITDMTMPQMTGDKLAQEILSIRPDMPIILCTGFSEKIDDARAQALGIRQYIEKPLILSNLAIVIRNVLD